MLAPFLIFNIINEMFKKINKNFEEVLCTFFLSVVFISVITQVILRFGFSSAAVWAEETAVYGLIFATYLGAALGIKRREHVRITFIVLSFPKIIDSSFKEKISYKILNIFKINFTEQNYLIKYTEEFIDLVKQEFQKSAAADC